MMLLYIFVQSLVFTVRNYQYIVENNTCVVAPTVLWDNETEKRINAKLDVYVIWVLIRLIKKN